MLILSKVVPMLTTESHLSVILLGQRFYALEKAFSELHNGILSVFVLPAQGMFELLTSRLVEAPKCSLNLLTSHLIMPDGNLVHLVKFFIQSPPVPVHGLQLTHRLGMMARQRS